MKLLGQVLVIAVCVYIASAGVVQNAVGTAENVAGAVVDAAANDVDAVGNVAVKVVMDGVDGVEGAAAGTSNLLGALAGVGESVGLAGVGVAENLGAAAIGVVDSIVGADEKIIQSK